MVTVITIDHPGEWNPHYDTEQGQYTYRVRAFVSGEKNPVGEFIILDTSETLSDVQEAAASLINPKRRVELRYAEKL